VCTSIRNVKPAQLKFYTIPVFKNYSNNILHTSESCFFQNGLLNTKKVLQTLTFLRK